MPRGEKDSKHDLGAKKNNPVLIAEQTVEAFSGHEMYNINSGW